MTEGRRVCEFVSLLLSLPEGGLLQLTAAGIATPPARNDRGKTGPSHTIDVFCARSGFCHASRRPNCQSGLGATLCLVIEQLVLERGLQ